MHLISLELNNYRQFEHAALQFPDGVVGIIGLNGSGKSTLVEAIAWALYGNAAVRTVKEEIKRDTAGADEDVSVVLRWELSGASYEVSRKLRGARLTPEVEFRVNGQLQAQSAKGVQAALEKALGLDWQAFYTSFFARQKELNALSDLQASARKDLILRMLRIDAVDTAMDMAKEQAKELKIRRDTLNQRLADGRDPEQELAAQEKEVKTCAKRSAELAKEQAGTEKGFNVLKKKYSVEKEKAKLYQEKAGILKQLELKLEQQKRYLQKAQKEQSGLGLNAERAGLLAQEYKQAKAEVVKAQKALEGMRLKLKELVAQKDIYHKQYQELIRKEEHILSLGPKAKCPTCQRSLAGDFETIKEHFAGEKSTLIEQGKKLNVLINKGKAAEKEKEQGLKELEKKEHRSALEHQENLAAAAKQEQVGKQIKFFEQEIAKLGPELKLKSKELAQLAFEPEAFSGLEQEYESLAAKVQQGKERLQQSGFELELAKKEAAQLRQLAEERAETAVKVKELSAEHEEVQKLVQVFGDFRVYLISKIRPTLSRIAGRLFSQMTQGKYQGLELDEDYEIHIEDEGRAYALQRFSGGETDLANLCLRLAIAQYVSEQHGAEMHFLVLDEIFGGQDVLRKPAILEALGELNKRFRQILLITHVEDLKDIVGDVVRVYEDEAGISQLQS